MQGWGRITGPHTVEVKGNDGTTTTLSAKNIMIATGSEVTPMRGMPVDEKRWGRRVGRLLSGAAGGGASPWLG